MENELKLGLYRHFKGNNYEVLAVAIHTETNEKMVVYKALYGAGGVFVRPLDMFTETVEANGKRVNRFTYIGEN